MFASFEHEWKEKDRQTEREKVQSTVEKLFNLLLFFNCRRLSRSPETEINLEKSLFARDKRKIVPCWARFERTKVNNIDFCCVSVDYAAEYDVSAIESCTDKALTGKNDGANRWNEEQIIWMCWMFAAAIDRFLTLRSLFVRSLRRRISF